jgi:hypothetical protein
MPLTRSCAATLVGGISVLIGLALIAVAITGPPSTVAAQAQPGMETWDSDWGPVSITYGGSGSWKQSATQTGLIKSSQYDPSTGKLTFQYYQDWNKATGEAALTLSRDGMRFDGTWSQEYAAGGGDSGSWAMTRKEPSLLLQIKPVAGGTSTDCPAPQPQDAPLGDAPDDAPRPDHGSAVLRAAAVPVARAAQQTGCEPAAARAKFQVLLPTLQGPRCANCHGAFDVFAADTSHPGGQRAAPDEEHPFGDCADCHTAPEEARWRQPAMVDPARWGGKDAVTICRALMASRINGSQLVEHITNDPLVTAGFAGTAGGQRSVAEKPPMEQAEFVNAAQAWVDSMGAASRWPDPGQFCA